MLCNTLCEAYLYNVWLSYALRYIEDIWQFNKNCFKTPGESTFRTGLKSRNCIILSYMLYLAYIPLSHYHQILSCQKPVLKRSIECPKCCCVSVMAGTTLGGPPKTLGFILLKPWITTATFMEMWPLVFQMCSFGWKSCQAETLTSQIWGQRSFWELYQFSWRLTCCLLYVLLTEISLYNNYWLSKPHFGQIWVCISVLVCVLPWQGSWPQPDCSHKAWNSRRKWGMPLPTGSRSGATQREREWDVGLLHRNVLVLRMDTLRALSPRPCLGAHQPKPSKNRQTMMHKG